MNVTRIASQISSMLLHLNTLTFFQISCTLLLAFIVITLVMPVNKRKASSMAKPTPAARSKKARVVEQHYSGSAGSGPSPVQQNIRKLFDKYRDDAVNEPDKIGLEGTEKYFEAIGVALDDIIFLAVFDLLDAPAMGEFNRESFVTGWANVSSTSNPCDTEKSQKDYVNVLRNKLTTDSAYFRQVYKSAFKYAKPANQRAIPMDEVFAYWEMFYNNNKSGMTWNTADTKWYDLWQEYYTEKNKRPVNKDLWNQVAELVHKTREEGGESLEWWSEDGAWPTAVDDFVAFVREKRMDTS